MRFGFGGHAAALAHFRNRPCLAMPTDAYASRRTTQTRVSHPAAACVSTLHRRHSGSEGITRRPVTDSPFYPTVTTEINPGERVYCLISRRKLQGGDKNFHDRRGLSPQVSPQEAQEGRRKEGRVPRVHDKRGLSPQGLPTRFAYHRSRLTLGLSAPPRPERPYRICSMAPGFIFWHSYAPMSMAAPNTRGLPARSVSPTSERSHGSWQPAS